jgi:D-3-phosphoglycerate dehydrogenase
MSKIKVVVTDYVEPDLDWELKQFNQYDINFSFFQMKDAPRENLLSTVRDADVIIVNMAPIDEGLISALKNCKLVIRHGVGYDNVDVKAANEHGIQVAYVPDYCVNEVAEQAVMLMFACQRKLLIQTCILTESAAEKKWLFDPIYPVFSIKGKTLGLIGCGRIGSTVLKMMGGFDINFLVCDPYLSDRRKQALGTETVSFDRVLRESDVISLHTPLNAETYHLIDEEELRIMKSTAVLINTSRGGVVNLNALDAALVSGELAHAGIDVYEKEPPEHNLSLLQNPNAICTPHLAWLSEESGWSIREKIVEDVIRFLNGEPPRYPIELNANKEPKSYK